MTELFLKRFSVIALTLTSVLLIFIMVQLVGVVTGTAPIDIIVPSHTELLTLNSLAVVLLLMWVGVYLFRIYGEYKRRVPGTQLAMRILGTIVGVTLFSMSVVYVFSFLALSRGIDNWFEVEVGGAVEEAIQLRAIIFDSFESRTKDDLEEVINELSTMFQKKSDQEIAAGTSASSISENNSGFSLDIEAGFANEENFGISQLAGSQLQSDSTASDDTDSQGSIRSRIFDLLIDVTKSTEYEEVTFFGEAVSTEGLVVSSISTPGSLLEVQPSQRLIEQLFIDTQVASTLDMQSSQDSADGTTEKKESSRDGNSTSELLRDDDGSALLRVLIPIPVAGQPEPHYLQVLTTLPLSSLRLAERVSQMNEQHERLQYLKAPLKFSIVLALTFVTLVVVLIATWAAIGLTRQLVAPIRTLSEGTKAVAEGRYEILNPITARDDLGVLVESFNHMTRQIKGSQEQISQSRQLAEEHSAYLESVLKHLSSGVMFIDRDERLTSINLATENILEVEPEEIKGVQLRDMIDRKETYSPLFASIAKSIERKDTDWNDTVKLDTDQGEQMLSFSVTQLPVPVSAAAMYVVVIEDITALVQAQRGVAWKEVARRMAHEMLNPLQPIQLAFERIQYKTNAHLHEEQIRTLELTFAAISRHLSSLTRIVKEFKDYPHPVSLERTNLDLNQLIREAIALHETSEQIDHIKLDLDVNLPQMHGDPEKLVQVFNNLINNAMEAVKESKELKKVVLQIESFLSERGKIVIRVIDNGPGFDWDVLDRIFEPYATTKKHGMGFGLEIVKRIVEAHGGSVSAKNNPNGTGAQIQMEFEIASESPKLISDVVTFEEHQQEAVK